MPVDLDFPAVRRRLRQLDDRIRAVERVEEVAATHTPGTVYLLDQYIDEYEQLDYLMQYWMHQHSGYPLNRWQWGVFVAAMAVASTLLMMYLVQVLR